MDKHLTGRDLSFQSTTKNGHPDDLLMFLQKTSGDWQGPF
jgi:hypothetical protein